MKKRRGLNGTTRGILSSRHLCSYSGFTLIELIVATTILLVLTSAAVPLARVTVQREKERQLRESLQRLRDALDRYKDAADQQAFLTKVDSQNYPPDLETLVKGVEIKGGKKLRFLKINSSGPNDQEHGVGFTVYARRSRFRFLGWPERL